MAVKYIQMLVSVFDGVGDMHYFPSVGVLNWMFAKWLIDNRNGSNAIIMSFGRGEESDVGVASGQQAANFQIDIAFVRAVTFRWNAPSDWGENADLCIFINH